MAEKKKYSPIAKEHHVVRRCGYQVIERDQVTNNVVGLYPAAMKLRPEMSEEYLSVNWLEHVEGSKNDRLKAIVAIHKAKARSGRLSPHSGVAVLTTGTILEIGTQHGRRLAVRFTPTSVDPSYSRISGLPLNNADELLCAKLADEAFKDFLLLSDIR
jgi:hypothetical protein